MHSLRFTKMEGAGNDYVYVDAIRGDFDLSDGPRLAPILSDRHFGVGSDGLIAMAPSEVADLRMVMWNADGSRGSMCGNGLRCVTKLAFDTGVLAGTEGTVETDVGVRSVELTVGDAREVLSVAVDMGEVTAAAMPETVHLCGEDWTYHAAYAGNPHAVMFFDRPPAELPVHKIGAMFQDLPQFSGGVNVEFVQVVSANKLVQRTYERGSGETLACGSGATAAAQVALVTERVPGPRVEVSLLGGSLIIRQRSNALVMEGPARTVYAGVFLTPLS